MNERTWSFRRLYETTNKQIDELLTIDDIMNVENYCKEAEADIAIIRQKLYEQINKLQSIRTEKYIMVRRYDRWKGPIEISVYLEESKEIDGYKRTFMEYGTFQKFNGAQKKKALEYAEELKNKFNIKIVKENWK